MLASRIEQLAAEIQANTAIVSHYIRKHDLPMPSFDVNSPLESVIPKDATEIENARLAVIDATKELRDLMLGPREYIMSWTHNEQVSQQAILRFKLVHSFPVGEKATFKQIAETTGLSEVNVKRIIRHAVIKRFFSEPEKGVVAHTAATQLLAQDKVIHDWLATNCDELWQSASHTVEAMARFPNSEEPNETGFALVNKTEKSFYQFLADYPERASRFGNSMKCFTEGPGFELDHVVNGFPWGKLKDGTVVDVGGSRGFVDISLAQAYPSLKFIVQDLPSAIEGAEKRVPQDVASRIQFMPYNFMNEQPVEGADVYFFRWILHNWSDKYCLKILRNAVPALKPGARVIVCDNVLPDPGTVPQTVEDRLRSMDLTMLEIQNARERDVEDWEALFKAADDRFEFEGASAPEGSSLWMMVARWRG